MRTPTPDPPRNSGGCRSSLPMGQAEREETVRKMAAEHGCEWKAEVLIANREDSEMMLYSPVDVMRAILVGDVARCCSEGAKEDPPGATPSTRVGGPDYPEPDDG